MNQRRKRERAKAIIAAKARARTSAHATLALDDLPPQPGSNTLDALPSKPPQTPAWRNSHLYLILVLPILILARNTSYIYTPAGYLDPWIYYAFMKHLVPFKGSLFPSTYYGSRLSWILPGALVHAVLPPVPAIYVLHLTVFFTAIFSLYWLLKEAFDRKIAILSAICLAMYPYFWEAVGWDYVDGVGIAYYLLSMALLFAATRRTGRHNPWLLIGAGMAYAGMIYTNIAWLICSPSFLALYLWPVPELTIKKIFKLTFRFLLWFGIGWAAVTAFLGVINWFLEGTFWFYAPSVLFSLSEPRSQPRLPNYSWVKTAYWLGLPMLACLCSLIIGVRTFWKFRRGDMRLFFALNLLYSAAVFVYLEVSGRPGTLKLFYYASYLIPSSILVVGAGLFENTSVLRESRFRLIVAAALAGLLSVWAFITVPSISTLTLNHLTFLFLAGVGMTAVGALLGRRSAGAIFGLAGLTLFCVFVKARTLRAEDYGDVFRRISSGMEAIENTRGGQSVRFWFSQDDPYSAEFHSLNACYLWAYTAMTYRFPSLDTVSVNAGDFIVVPSSKPDIFAGAAGAIASQGFTARLLSKERNEFGGKGYWLNFLAVEPDRAHMVPMQISIDAAGVGHLEPSRDAGGMVSFPNDRWQMSSGTSGKGSMQMSPEGVQVETLAIPWAWSAIYPEVVASEPGLYRFVLKYRLLRGDAGFGALKHDRSDWLEQSHSFYRVGPDTIREFTASLGRDQAVWLLTANNRGVHASSRYVIEDLRAYRYEKPGSAH